MLKKFRERNIHLLIVVFATGLFLGLNLSFVKSAEESTLKYLDHFHFVYQTIKNQFVENHKSAKIFEGAIRGMIESLNDPYSRYLDKKDYAEFKQAVTGKFVGVGIEISIKDDEVIVIAPIEDGPAQKAGILPGDTILKVDGTNVKGENISDVIKKIKGKPDSTTTLLIRRDGFPEPLSFNIKRASINVKSTKFGIIKEFNKIGYLKIAHFYDTTPAEVEGALKQFNKNKIDKVILDLRDNPGGNLDAAVRISDMFLPKNKVIVSTRGREGLATANSEEKYKSKSSPIYNKELIILANNGSASASEVLSGALKDNKRAKLVGQKTFGKALVQQLIDIESNKTGFTLTIRKYYTPSGALIHKKGISPDIKLKENLIPAKDRKNLARILNDRLIETFSKEHKVYNKENTQKLISFLKGKNLQISEKVAAYYFKLQLGRYQKRPLYDLEFDNELVKTINIINEK